MRMYHFVLDGSCPSCGKQLDEPGSVQVEGSEAFVNDDGVLAENEDTDLILTNPEPEVTCRYCKGVLQVDPVEEQA